MNNEKKVLELLQRVESCEKQIQEIQEEKDRLLIKILEIRCPFKIGDITKCLGYAYRGKDMLIESRSMRRCGSYEGNHWIWRVRGRIKKKNGELSVNEGDFDEWDFEQEIKRGKNGK